MIIQKRLVLAAGVAFRNPFDPADPQISKVIGVVGINFNPAIQITIMQRGRAVADTFDFWDIVTFADFDPSGYIRIYEATRDDATTIDGRTGGGGVVVVRDLFGPGDFSHTWSGWPAPGMDWPYVPGPLDPPLFPPALLPPQPV